MAADFDKFIDAVHNGGRSLKTPISYEVAHKINEILEICLDKVFFTPVKVIIKRKFDETFVIEEPSGENDENYN